MNSAVEKIKDVARPLYHFFKYRMWSRSGKFHYIYAKNEWGYTIDKTRPFFSGWGSYDPAVLRYVDLVKEIIGEHRIKSVVEIGCGDFAVAERYVSVCNSYLGIDLVRPLIENNRVAFGTDSIKFKCADVCHYDVGAFDLCILRQVLQHLSNADIKMILDNTKKCKYMLVTEHVPSAETVKAINLDKPTGRDIRLEHGSGIFIDQEPFNLQAQIVLEAPVQVTIYEPNERFVTWLVTRAG